MTRTLLRARAGISSLLYLVAQVTIDIMLSDPGDYQGSGEFGPGTFYKGCCCYATRRVVWLRCCAVPLKTTAGTAGGQFSTLEAGQDGAEDWLQTYVAVIVGVYGCGWRRS